MSESSRAKLFLILEKIGHIETVVEEAGGISPVLQDPITRRPAILMHLTAIAEQFHKLKQRQCSALDAFNAQDLKGMYDVRTYIAHDYEGVNLAIIEWIIRYGLPTLKTQCNTAIKEFS